MSPKAKSVITSIVIVLLAASWILFFFDMLPIDTHEINSFCFLLVITVFLILILFKTGLGGITYGQTDSDAPDRFGRSF